MSIPETLPKSDLIDTYFHPLSRNDIVVDGVLHYNLWHIASLVAAIATLQINVEDRVLDSAVSFLIDNKIVSKNSKTDSFRLPTQEANYLKLITAIHSEMEYQQENYGGIRLW